MFLTAIWSATGLRQRGSRVRKVLNLVLWNDKLMTFEACPNRHPGRRRKKKKNKKKAARKPDRRS
jgi:hypothetical protein